MGGAEVPETLEDTLQGDGTEADPWILTQESFTNATGTSSPVSKTVASGTLTRVTYNLQAGCYKLDGNITLEYTGSGTGNANIVISDSVTLDLNGHTLTQTSRDIVAINVYGTLTLNDSSNNQSGKISGGLAGVSPNEGGRFTMNGGTIGNGKWGVIVDPGATFIMTGGLITETIIECVENSGTFEMKGGEIKASAGAIKNYGALEAEVGTAPCLVEGSVVNRSGGIINGGVFKGPVNNPGGSDGRGTINGGVFYDTVKLKAWNTCITGGVFYGEVENRGEITGGVFLGGITGNGTIEGTQHSITVDFGNGTTRNGIVVGDTLYPLGEPPVTREGYKFVGWYKDVEFTEPWDFTNQNPVEEGNMAFYAKWVCAGHTGGTATCQAQATCENCGEPYGERDSTNHVGTLGEWQKDADGHWKIYSCCLTVKGAEGAHSFGADGKCECGAVQYTVTFDPNGGTVDPTSATTDAYGKLTELPTPTRSGSYRFDGWFTEKNGGTAVTVDTVYEAHTTVYAHWTYTGSSGHTYYTIKATAGEGGSITPSGRAAVLYGASKTFTITPNDGYAIADVKVDGKSVGAVKTYTFERVRGDHTIEAVFMKATGNPQTGVDVPFTDVSENDWFYEDVAYVYANDLMKGTSETTFSPAVTTTRGMIVTILYRLEGEPTVSDTCPFEDVKSGSYYEKAITWAAANEIVGGYGNGKFGPDDAITREQMAVILYRYTQYKGMDVSVGEDTNILSYNDALDISEYAFSAMQWACGESILNGSDGNLMPQGNATRAQVAAILHRFCENILK